MRSRNRAVAGQHVAIFTSTRVVSKVTARRNTGQPWKRREGITRRGKYMRDPRNRPRS